MFKGVRYSPQGCSGRSTGKGPLESLLLPVQDDEGRLEDVDGLVDLLLGRDQARHEPDGLLPAREDEDAALAHQAEHLLDVLVPLERQAEDQTAAARRAGNQPRE